MAQKEVDLEKAFFLKSVDDDGQRSDLTELVEKLEMLSINVKEAQERIHKVETIRQLKTMEPENWTWQMVGNDRDHGSTFVTSWRRMISPLTYEQWIFGKINGKDVVVNFLRLCRRKRYVCFKLSKLCFDDPTHRAHPVSGKDNWIYENEKDNVSVVLDGKWRYTPSNDIELPRGLSWHCTDITADNTRFFVLIPTGTR